MHPVGKEEEAREFYTGILGLEEIPKPPQLLASGGLWYAIADIQLQIGAEDQVNLSKRHPAFVISDLLTVRNYLAEQKVLIKEEIKIEWLTRLSFTDPFKLSPI